MLHLFFFCITRNHLKRKSLRSTNVNAGSDIKCFTLRRTVLNLQLSRTQKKNDPNFCATFVFVQLRGKVAVSKRG